MTTTESLLKFYDTLNHDERGIVTCLVIDKNWWTGAKHCLALWWPGYIKKPDVVSAGDQVFASDDWLLRQDPVAEYIPELGQQVWIVKTNRTIKRCRVKALCQRQFNGITTVGVMLHGDGSPTQGDSGSIGIILQDGDWKALGMVSYSGAVEIARPLAGLNAALIKTEGFFNWNVVADSNLLNQPWVEHDTIASNSTTSPTDKPITQQQTTNPMDDKVSAFNEKPDGVPDVVLEVASPYPINDIVKIEVEGVGGDKWIDPPNNSNWSIWKHVAADDRLVLRFNRSQPAESYNVTLRSKNGASIVVKVSPMNFTKPPVPAPTPEQTTPPMDDSDVYKKRIAEMEAMLAWSRQENDKLKDELEKERQQAEALHSSLIRVGQAMGWAK